MKLVRFDMWQDSHKIALPEILAAVPENSLGWRMLSLHASGTDWLGRASIAELEEDVRVSPMGICVSWSELKAFASAITDLHDVLLAATPPNLTLRAAEIRSGDYRSASIVVEGIDDGIWVIGSSDESILRGLPKSWTNP